MTSVKEHLGERIESHGIIVLITDLEDEDAGSHAKDVLEMANGAGKITLLIALFPYEEKGETAVGVTLTVVGELGKKVDGILLPNRDSIILSVMDGISDLMDFIA